MGTRAPAHGLDPSSSGNLGCSRGGQRRLVWQAAGCLRALLVLASPHWSPELQVPSPPAAFSVAPVGSRVVLDLSAPGGLPLRSVLGSGLFRECLRMWRDPSHSPEAGTHHVPCPVLCVSTHLLPGEGARGGSALLSDPRLLRAWCSLPAWLPRKLSGWPPTHPSVRFSVLITSWEREGSLVTGAPHPGALPLCGSSADLPGR